MAQPSSRQSLIDYCKRKLGAPVLEINVADEQIDDLVDDALQFFNERHFDGVTQIYLKYQITQGDIDRGRAPAGNSTTAGIVTTTAMVKTYLEDIDFLLNTEKQIRFNQRMDRLYLDIDWASLNVGDYLVIDCWRLLDPNDFSRVWNDSFLKPYLTSLIKRQWGQNLIKFQGLKLPGGVELNGRQIYDDAQKEIDVIMEKMSNTYELPPLDMIG
ncbi:MAG: hypothetical protein EBR82_31715 [Caulobacteraceae bacterium]|nr:hypothetical protein [Caulobacteraceae bacterium]